MKKHKKITEFYYMAKFRCDAICFFIESVFGDAVGYMALNKFKNTIE